MKYDKLSQTLYIDKREDFSKLQGMRFKRVVIHDIVTFECSKDMTDFIRQLEENIVCKFEIKDFDVPQEKAE